MKQELLKLKENIEGRTAESFKVFAGLDGFIDEICEVVRSRRDEKTYERMETLLEFGELVRGASGTSANVEIVVKTVKIGGNGVILANALAELGCRIVYCGNLGYPETNPVFAPFVKNCERVYSLAEPGHTDALEFLDGKLMQGKLEPLRDITFDRIIETVGKDKLRGELEEANLVVFGNWTMIHSMTDIWRRILSDVLPGIERSSGRKFFFDLADPRKRDREEIAEACHILAEFEQVGEVILGLNEKESIQVADILGAGAPDICERARGIREKLGISWTVIHPVTHAASSGLQGEDCYEGPYCKNPVLTTGAGDNFNAGFCLGRLLGLDGKGSVLLGKAASGFYVRHARSASFGEIANFLGTWAQNHGGDF